MSKLENADGSRKVWTMSEVKDMLRKNGKSKPDGSTWGDALYVYAMMYADYFPKVLKCDKDLSEATIAHLEDPDAPDGTPFIRWIAIQDYSGNLDGIDWRDM